MESNQFEPAYVGDGVYVQIDYEDPSGIIVTTNSHEVEEADAVIYLGRREMISLRRYINIALGDSK